MKRIVSPRRLREYARAHPSTRSALDYWERTVRDAVWQSPTDVKQSFNTVDPVRVQSGRTVYVFNITRGHRLIAAIHFNTGVVYVLRLLAHEEYDLDRWKKEL